MKNDPKLITSKQLVFTIISATIGVGILTITSTVARVARQDAWISIIIGAFVPIIGIFTISLVAKKYPDLTFAEYNEVILGKWAGKILPLLFIAYTLFYAAMVTRIFVNVLKMYLFPTTPFWVLAMLILLISAYLAAQDFRVVVRVNELMFFESLVLLAFVLGAYGQFEVTFFQPVGEAGLLNILKGTYQTTFSYLGMEILLVVFPFVQKKNEVVKASITAVVIVAVIYLTVSIAVLGIFGPDVMSDISFALMVLLKTYNFPVIERAEFFFIIFWVFVAFRPVANMYFASRHTAEKLVGVNKPGLVTIILFPVALFTCLAPENFEQALQYSTVLGYFGFGFLIVIPLFLWLVSAIRSVGGEKNA